MDKSSRDSANTSCCRDVDVARRCKIARTRFSPAIRRSDAIAGQNRKLHGFLFFLSSRAQCRDHAARAGKRADAELEMVAGGLSRPGQLRCRQRDGSPAAKRADQTAGCGDTNVRANEEFGL